MQPDRVQYHLLPPNFINHTPRPFEVEIAVKAKSFAQRKTVDNVFVMMTGFDGRECQTKPRPSTLEGRMEQHSWASCDFGEDQPEYPAAAPPLPSQLELLSRKNESYDLAWFLRNTGPSQQRESVADNAPPKLVKRRTQLRRKPSLGFLRPAHKQESSTAPATPIWGRPSTGQGVGKTSKLPTNVVPRTSKDGKRYFQIVHEYHTGLSPTKDRARQCSSQPHELQSSVGLGAGSDSANKHHGDTPGGLANLSDRIPRKHVRTSSQELMQDALDLESWISNLGKQQTGRSSTANTIRESSVKVTVLDRLGRSRSMDRLGTPNNNVPASQSDVPDSGVAFTAQNHGRPARRNRIPNLQLASHHRANHCLGTALDARAALTSNPPTPGPAPIKPLPSVPERGTSKDQLKNKHAIPPYSAADLPPIYTPSDYPAPLRRANSENMLGARHMEGLSTQIIRTNDGEEVLSIRSPLRLHDGNARTSCGPAETKTSSIINPTRPTVLQRASREERIRARKLRDLRRSRLQFDAEVQTTSENTQIHDGDLSRKDSQPEQERKIPSSMASDLAQSNGVHAIDYALVHGQASPQTIMLEAERKVVPRGRQAKPTELDLGRSWKDSRSRYRDIPEQQPRSQGKDSSFKAADPSSLHRAMSLPTHHDVQKRLSILTESSPSHKRASFHSNNVSPSKSISMEARLEALERRNRILEAALTAVIRTSGNFKRCACMSGALPTGKRESLVIPGLPDSPALEMYYRSLQDGKLPSADA